MTMEPEFEVLAESCNILITDAKASNLRRIRDWCDQIKERTRGEIIIDVHPEGGRFAIGGRTMEICDHKIRLPKGEMFMHEHAVVITGSEVVPDELRVVECMLAHTLKIRVEWIRHPNAGIDIHHRESAYGIQQRLMRDREADMSATMTSKVYYGWIISRFEVSFDAELKMAKYMSQPKGVTRL